MVKRNTGFIKPIFEEKISYSLLLYKRKLLSLHFHIDSFFFNKKLVTRNYNLQLLKEKTHKGMKINKILIANRGEIARRVIRTCKQMGIHTVAVYSEADQSAPHVFEADEAVCIGPAPSSESYLRIDKVIEVALSKGADAVHPGYGFLSENPEFARQLEANQIILLGPSAESMEIMGSKLRAKEAVKAYGIPMVPGTEGAISDVLEAVKIADEIGYPVLIKASAGGGGKGMRIVESKSEMEDQIKMAISEATSAFGDGSVFIEKYVLKPRHIEFQILADHHGNVVHLFERECSIQRRHQKVIEEAPSSILTEELRQRMGEAAIGVAKACNYRGVGTVEFLVDKDLNFYFLEMNTRLQVEHPVTEMITGLDLVEQQIKVAEGKTLEFNQNDLEIKGHAVELRVYAEDPFNNFLPSINRLNKYQIPTGKDIRVDDAFLEGMEVPIYYDPMIAKLVTYGPNRKAAIRKMIEAIHSYHIAGIENTLDFGTFVMDHPAFLSGDFDTNFIKAYWSEEEYRIYIEDKSEAAATFIATLRA
jgi:acetyl-CoA carboxylase biotin carboxylase subunit